ncbi:ATP-dependent zinc protease family protein [Agromyces aerolatus]|uniref:ATP-dependent zinc protease family protein n=1 Tax=Agromyces sp. LY-1074 TaxID=3074080 RepID=UPI002866C498|nr:MULTISPECIES: RimK/LysX family protein [unclassified Agromyces]MDR5701570.1 RimK/LysX family protein [Agromyces sp. LY-1074]MDR5707823.1 RimK/LysX family protein [Agromyces sp. LY-1358]
MGRVSEPTHSTIAGWREWASLPAIGVPWIKVKLDTGARTSALHAFDVEELERDGAEWVRFGVRPWQDSDEDAVVVETRVHDRREVRSSSGHVTERIVVELELVLHDRRVAAEVTLTNRDEMGFRMLVGREALRGTFLVDPGASFLGGRPPRPVRRQNRGR